MSSWRDTLALHYHKKWGGEVTSAQITTGPVRDLPPDFCILKFAPTDDRKVWVYATAGMAQPGDKGAVEIHLMTGVPADEFLLDLVYATAHYHRTARRLTHGDTVYFGRPWLPNSLCGHGLASLPYLDGPDLENVTIEQTPVRCLWLIPVTAPEVACVKNLGLEALEKRFEHNQVNFIDPYRKSVA